ncbi:MAG: SCO family protein [Thiotrichales bacterium]
MRAFLALCLALGISVVVGSEAPRAAITLADLGLRDHHDQPWPAAASPGKVTLVSFGYTSCPDVCPLTLQVIAAALRALGDQAAEVLPLFISVDPARDQPQRLKDYVGYFDPRIIGLSGDAGAIVAVTARFGAVYALGASKADGPYTVDHSVDLFVLDATGTLVARVPFGLPAEHIAQLVRPLLKPDRTLAR